MDTCSPCFEGDYMYRIINYTQSQHPVLSRVVMEDQLSFYCIDGDWCIKNIPFWIRLRSVLFCYLPIVEVWQVAVGLAHRRIWLQILYLRCIPGFNRYRLRSFPAFHIDRRSPRHGFVAFRCSVDNWSCVWAVDHRSSILFIILSVSSACPEKYGQEWWLVGDVSLESLC